MAETDVIAHWERAEIARSGSQALRSERRVTATPARVFDRYMRPLSQTAYPWEYAFHLLGDTTGRRVLDLGCGDGECTTLVAAHGGTVTALDISTDLLAVARRRTVLDGAHNRVKLLCGSVHAIPLPSESMDVVFGMAVLHHVDLRLAAHEVHRVLARGGRAIFAEPIRNSKVIEALRAMIPYRQPDVSPFERPLRFDEVDEFVSTFRASQRRTFELPFVQLSRVCRVSPILQSWAYNVDRRLLRRLPQLGRFASVIVFEVYK
jgi:ubiquinone/menaquinone biosynthesis C-methylase UbiE